MNNNEKKVKQIIDNLISKHQNKIPRFTDEFNVKFNIVPHSHPILTLNTFHLRCSMPKVAYLRTFVHENLHWFYADRINHRTILYFENKYIKDKVDEDGDLITNTIIKDVELTDPKTGKVTTIQKEFDNDDYDDAVNKYKMPTLNNKYSTIEHLAVIWNELNILNPQGKNVKDKLITQREYDWLYYKYNDVYPNSKYMRITYWLMKNFREVEYDLSRFNLIWTPKDNKVLKPNVISMSMDQLNNVL